MKQRQSRGLMPWILTLLCAVLLTVWVLGSMPAAPKEGAAVAAGTAYLDSAAAKDASAIAETLREREKQRRAELLAKQKQEERDALVAKITSGELDIWSMFDSYVILGDSRAVGFYYFDFLEKSRVLADGGNTIRFADQGPGIDDKERAFDFGVTSANSKMKRYIRGTGAGFPMVQEYLENAGGAAVLLEKDCSGQALFQAACGILHDGARRASMERAMSALGIRDATERIYQTVLEICQ